MQPITRLLCTFILAATSPLVWASDATSQARQQWYEGIATGYQSLKKETGALAERARDYCRNPAPQSREQLEAAWLDAFLAWQRVRFVDFGPVENNNLSWQFQFWPDPKNLVARKAAYLTGDEEPITPQVISQSGVAVQGFPMIEYLLFDQTFNTGDNKLPAPRTCELLTGVAAHVESNGDELMTRWQGFRPHYLKSEQYFDTTVRAGMAALEILEERRLAQPMGLRGNGKRNRYIANAWHSGETLKTIEATVDGLDQFFLPGLTTALEGNEEKHLAERIRNQFNEVQQNFPGAYLPMATALDEEVQFRVLQGLYVDVSQLTILVNDQAAVALNVVRGFNSSDGD